LDAPVGLGVSLRIAGFRPGLAWATIGSRRVPRCECRT